MMTGNFPYGRVSGKPETNFKNYTPAKTYNAEIQDWLEEIVQKACAVNYEERYQSAAEFLGAINNPNTEIENKKRGHVSQPAAEIWQWLVLCGIGGLLILLVFFCRCGLKYPGQIIHFR
jgi:hypothetical protein